MPVQTDSVLDLLWKLCDLHLGETKRCHLVQPKVDRDEHHRRLKRSAFDQLFSFLKSPDSKRSWVGAGGVPVDVDAVLQTVFQLRTQRRFQDADRLETTLEQFLGSCGEEDTQVLRLLVCLAGSGSSESTPPLGHDLYHMPVLTEENQPQQTTLPAGPLCYGDSRQPATSDSCLALVPYVHFPSQLFQVSGADNQVSSSLTAAPSIFSLTPGTGIGGGSLFSVERDPRDQHERQTRLSLFGGMVQTQGVSLAVRLQLPDLPDDPQSRPVEIRIPKAISMSELSEDEGFITTEASSSATTPADSLLDDDVWELALTTTPCQHYIWERIGCEPMVTEQRYLTEAGPRGLDEIFYLRRHQERLVEAGGWGAGLRQVTEAQLGRDLVYLLIGIPSHTFPFCQAKASFSLSPGVFTSGLTHQSLASCVADFVIGGNHYRRLAAFAVPMEGDSRYTGGLVLQALTGAVRSVLQHYRAAVLSLPTHLSLLALRMHCDKALRQMAFLAELCGCRGGTPAAGPGPSFPQGVSLISYLYQETLESVNTDHYLLMLSILRTTCQPFVLFVQDWVFHGTFRDVYGEFMIQINPKFLEARDELYWEKGYTLTVNQNDSCVPLFLADLAPAIFRCGKALNLLRMCSPQHFLCGVSDGDIPRLSISYLRSDLRYVTRQCDMYVSRMRQVARRLVTSRAEQQKRVKEAQRQLLETARRMAAQEIARLQGILDARRQRHDVKKRKEFRRLKEQMATDLQRRAGETADEKEADRQYMAQLTRQEEALTQKEMELEQQARDQLIAFYEDLGEEAARREQRALWRIRRARLETARIQLLAADDEKWKLELDEQRQARDLLEQSEAASSVSLPDWVQRREGSSSPLHVQSGQGWGQGQESAGQERDWTPPKWVDRQLPVEGGEREADAVVAGQLPVEGGEEVGERTGGEGVGTASGQEVGERTEGEDGSPGGQDGGVSAFGKEGGEEISGREGGGRQGGSAPASSDRERGASSDREAGHAALESAEDRMPAWARRVLTQSLETGGLETLMVDDADHPTAAGDDGQDSSLHPPHSGSDERPSPSPPTLTLPHGGAGNLESVAYDAAAADSFSTCGQLEGSSEGVTEVKDVKEHDPDSQAGQSGVAGSAGSVCGRQVRRKSGLRMVDGMCTNQQTEEKEHRPHIQVSGVHANTESTGTHDTRPHVRRVEGMSATKETEPDQSQRPHIKASEVMHAARETEEGEQRPHLRTVADRGANLESSEEVKAIPRMGGSALYNIATETTSSEWAVKKPSLFGHVSQLSRQDSNFQIPAMRKLSDRHVSLQSEVRDFAIKPNIRMHHKRSATAQSTETEQRPMIRSYAGRHANQESEFVDHEGIRRRRFLEQNVFGHSSDSSVQRLLYGDKFGTKAAAQLDDIPEAKQLVPTFDLSALDLMPEELQKYEDSFGHLNGVPMVDLVAGVPGVSGGLQGMLGEAGLSQDDAEAVAFTPLSVLLQHALINPLSAQISLVNETVVNYFFVELKMESHFEALHRYLFMADGDFAHNLTDILLEKLSSCSLPQEMLTPVFLNAALTRALQLSSCVDSQHASSLSFALRYLPESCLYAHDTLDCLELRYKVSWPVNVVITEGCQALYGQVFSFMLQLKRVAWTLTDCWYKLKRDAIVKKAKDSCQYRQLQLHRQEMLHFVRVMEAYMANQIIQLTWGELQQALDGVSSLDQLKEVHATYLHNAVFRCLLNQKASSIMSLIQNIFSLILKFCSQLASAAWEKDAAGEVTHPNFAAMVTSYNSFKKYFAFLFTVVKKLALRGYSPHLHELLLRLNFNDYYSNA